MELSPAQTNHILNRFPSFELSYETISHKKVSPSYNICFAIPQGKKCYAWFTFLGDKDVCFLMDLNKDKKITKIYKTNIEFNKKLSLNTIVYGTFLEDDEDNDKDEDNQNQKQNNCFVVEDILFFEGISLKKSNPSQKLCISTEFMELTARTFHKNNSIVFSLPVLWEINQKEDFELTPNIPDKITETVSYPMHHLQYRSLYETSPYLNVFLNRKINVIAEPKKTSSPFLSADFIPDFSKPQYRYTSVFQVTADSQFDIYHLFAYGKNNKPVYYNVAYIPNYKTSVFMNGLFRNIKENKNLDYIEESEDEDEFQDVSDNKYVDVDKVLLIECAFNMKFKKWTPLRVVNSDSKIVHIGKLSKDDENYVRNTYPKNNYNNQNNYKQNTNNNQNNYKQNTNNYQNNYKQNPSANNYRQNTNNYPNNQRQNTNNYRQNQNNPRQNI